MTLEQKQIYNLIYFSNFTYKFEFSDKKTSKNDKT